MAETTRTLPRHLPPDGDPSESTAACLAVALRADAPLAPTSRHILDGVSEVALRRGDVTAVERTRRAKGESGDGMLIVSLPDRWMSGRHARLVRTWDKWRVEDMTSLNGTFVNGERVTERHLEDGDVIEIGSTLLVFRAAEPVLPDLDASSPADTDDGLWSLRPGVARVFAQVREIARSPIQLLVCGEPGTGKEVLTRAVHALSGRTGELVAINCGALAPNLVESELFGYRKGAFSGATEDRLGLVRAAHGGTLLLDEIGDLAPSAQAALLRVLQEHEVLPVGSTRPLPVDLRVVAATHRDLDAAIERGLFRADLRARLAGLVVHLPPLRERREDIGFIVGFLLRKIAPNAPDIAFTFHAARALVCNGWPGNVRELEQALRAAVVLARSGTIGEEHLFPRDVPRATQLSSERVGTPAGDDRRRQLEELLIRHKGNVSAVARELGKARAQVHRWIRAYDLQTWRIRGSK